MNQKEKLKILFPINGDMLNSRDGNIIDGCLVIKVKIYSLQKCRIIVNGETADFINGLYTANVILKEYKNTIEILDIISGQKDIITVYYLKDYSGKYRLSLDDNIWFLKDIAINSDKYKSIFENEYLYFLRKVNREFGTKIHMNIYYQEEGFNISNMPDKYKSEWKENSEWLRLSFHALQDKPDKPYMNSSYDEMKRDCELVIREIRRFAGDELIGPVTTLHWGEATVEGCRALRDAGCICQVGDFNVDNELPPVSYYLDVDKRRHINNRFIWKDELENIIFFRSSIIIDCHRLDKITDFLDRIYEDPVKSGFIDLLIHEQYFYPNYFNYQADYRQKVMTSIEWAVSKGYKPAFLSDCVFK
jgi:hypothetical protein